MSELTPAARRAFGLVLIGDWVLATGQDALAGALIALLGPGARWRFIEASPADPAAIAEVLSRAQRRPFTVIVAGGLGSGVDDWTWVVLEALARGQAQMLGQKQSQPTSLHVEHERAYEHGNLLLLPGSPERALSAFRAWFEQQAAPTTGSISNSATPTQQHVLIPWTLPESEQQRQARRYLFERHPEVLQGIVRGRHPDELALELTASSRSRLDKAVRFLRAQMRTPRTSSPTKPGPR